MSVTEAGRPERRPDGGLTLRYLAEPKTGMNFTSPVATKLSGTVPNLPR